MDSIEIAKVLSDWASALSSSEQFKTRRTSLRDLVKKYSRDAHPEESITSALKRSVRPWSHEDFTARLLTFQKSTAWFAKPPMISALQCARYGWCNGGVDQIYCLTCGAKASHSKVDDDGKSLREALSSGHYSHCGWIDNFCSEVFLCFPVKSSESLRVDFLQRVRIVLLAIAEWSRDVCETNNNGTLAVKLPSNSKLQVQVGSSIRDSAPELSKWLLGGQRDSGSANVILSTILSDISNPSCRGYLAMAVEVIDGLISCSGDCNISSVSASDSALSSKDGITEKSLIDGSSSTILQALLLPMVDASSAENLLNSHELIRISVLMAMCGWTAISSANIAAAKSADDIPASIPTSVTATGEICTSMQVSILDSFRCDLCGRSVPFKYLLCSPVDPLYQHRTFCLWANASEQNLEVDSELKIKSEVPAGWLQCVKAVINLDNNPLITSLSQRESIGVSVQNHQDKIEHGREELCSDAEQAYKKIKLVLDRAAFNRVGQKSRQSI